MIGSGLKKMAKENGMTVSGGVAYGSLRGFAATISEGAGYKQIVFAVSFPDPAGRVQLMDLVGVSNVKKTYRVMNIGFAPKSIQVMFHDTIGTMKKIRAFLDWFLPLLEQYGATGVNICTECGCELTTAHWVQINGICYPLHDSCAQKVQREVEADNVQKAEENTGNYISGTVGALVGAAIGAVLWAFVLNQGYVASLVGLVIGWLAEKGYNLLKGKQGKAKVAILIVAIVLGVVLGTFGSDAMTLMEMMNAGQLPGFTFADIPMFIIALLADNPEYRQAIVYNVGMGLLFAGLGVFFILRQTARDVSGTKFRSMK